MSATVQHTPPVDALRYSFQDLKCSSDSHDDTHEDSETRFADAKMMVIHSMIKQIRNGTPVYRLQLPIFLSEPRSLLERYSDFCTHIDYILRIPTQQDPLERFLSVTKFYLSGWHTRAKDIRNPFNPVIGEIFRCQYDHGDSVSYYVAEQISHHPPSTAFSIVNEVKGLVLNAYIRPVIKFRGNSLDVCLEGKLVGQIRDHSEEYEIGFPHIVVKGVLVGAIQITLAGTAILSCAQSGYYAEFDFKTKGLVRGKHNYVVANIKHTSSKKTLYTIEGRWDGVMNITSVATNETLPFLDIHNAPVCKQVVPPLENQAENESQRVWRKVVENILKNNEGDALVEKHRVEENQRELERERAKNKVSWTPRLFHKMGDDYYVHRTLSSIASNPDTSSKKAGHGRR